MHSTSSLKVLCAVSVFLLTALSSHPIGRMPDEEAMSALFGRGKADGKPPFELPDALPGGGVKMFHRAQAKHSYEYSQGGRVHVYHYSGADTATEDFAAFAKGAEKFDEKASASLAKQGACLTRQKDSVTLWVVLDESVAGFELPKEKWSLADAAKMAEAVVNAENARIAKLFGNPERALTTYFKAVEKMDEAQLFRSLSTGGDEAAQSKLNRLRAMMPMMNLMMMEHFGEMMGGERPRQLRAPKVGKPEKTKDGQVFVPLSAENVNEESVWFMLLVVATGQEKLMRGGGMMNRRGNEPMWVPMAQVGNRWAVDLPTLSKTMFSKVTVAKEEGDCFGNLRQLLLGLKAYAEDDDDGKFPNKLSTLLEEDYLPDVKVFIAPKSATKIKDASEVDAKTDFTYEGAGKPDDDDGDSIIIYDKAGSHDGKGRHVGFADGHVQWVEEAQFKKLLEDQRAGAPNVPKQRRRVVPPNRGVAPMPMPVPDVMPPDEEQTLPQTVPGGAPTEIQPLPAERAPARPPR